MNQFKLGNEFLPYHPNASHVQPDYRDGWNACFEAANIRCLELEAKLAQLREATGVKHEPKLPVSFVREKRYIVFKNKDVARLNLHQRLKLKEVQDTIDAIRSTRGKSELECVVVESDDAAYELTWDLIKQSA